MEIDGPLVSSERLDELKPLWLELHAHHLAVAEYRNLVSDLEQSWQWRRAWYEQLISEHGSFFIARDAGLALGYAMTYTTVGPDDTFAVQGGTVEIVSLVVAGSRRGRGIGSALLTAVHESALARGLDTLKVAVMVGNERALEFYVGAGFSAAEEVLYLTV
jgi:ribosomal protein S18 acetylase RimI-like enzyme